MIIGIAGKARHGKDSVCKFLGTELDDEEYYNQRRALADALKEEVASVLSGQYNYMDYQQKFEVYQEILAEMYADNTKEKYRTILQWWGTDFKRKVFGSDYWRAKLFDWYKEFTAEHGAEGVAIVPDIRFPDEADMVRSLGGLNVKVVRPSIVSQDQHASETALDSYEGWDLVISADNLDDLKREVVEKLLPMVKERING